MSEKQKPVANLDDAGFEELLEHYWQIAYAEGKTGESHGDEANEILFRLRSLYTHPQPKREPLTDECKKGIRHAIGCYFDDAYTYSDELYGKVLDVLAAHGIKGDA